MEIWVYNRCAISFISEKYTDHSIDNAEKTSSSEEKKLQLPVYNRIIFQMD